MNKYLFNKFLDGETSTAETEAVLKAIRTTSLWRQRYIAVKRYEAMLAEEQQKETRVENNYSDISFKQSPIRSYPLPYPSDKQPKDNKGGLLLLQQEEKGSSAYVEEEPEDTFEDSIIGTFHCPNCGHPIALTHLTCPHCGRKLGVEDY